MNQDQQLPDAMATLQALHADLPRDQAHALYVVMQAALTATQQAAPSQGVSRTHLERGDAVNLARNLRQDQSYEKATHKGIRVLCDAVLQMDAFLLKASTQRETEILRPAEISAMKDELAKIAVAVGRSKTDGNDCDWFDLAGDVEALASTQRERPAASKPKEVNKFDYFNTLVDGKNLPDGAYEYSASLQMMAGKFVFMPMECLEMGTRPTPFEPSNIESENIKAKAYWLDGVDESEPQSSTPKCIGYLDKFGNFKRELPAWMTDEPGVNWHAVTYLQECRAAIEAINQLGETS